MKNFFFLISLVLSLYSCQKKMDVGTPPDSTPTLVSASIAGRITDINNVPVVDAIVTAGISTTTSDVNGQFIIRNAQLNKDEGLVKVAKTGFFKGSRTFLVNNKAVNNIKISLIPKEFSGSFAVASGGNIVVSGGGAVNFTASSIVNTNSGSAYTGNVSVYTFYLNPADANFKNYMPGNLLGLNASNQQKILQSFGMVSVEMNDASGNSLQLATGKTATITIPIPSALLVKAPATIPLWYFNDTTGIWRQEGNATKQGTDYVGTVAHFSFWTAAQLGQSVRLDVTFKDQTGNAVANKLVRIISINYGSSDGYTDSAGTVSGFIPASETLEMKIVDQCGGTMDSLFIGPFSTDTNMGSITVRTTASNSVTLSGTVVNCSNESVTNGYVQVNIGNDHFNSAITNGNFSITYPHCSNLIAPDSIIAYDAVKNQQSIPQSINGINSSQNIGQLIACAVFPPPVAGFTYALSGTVLPITVNFSNHSSNAMYYLWSFGDGGSSSLVDASHVYTIAGDYTVTLTATGIGGTNSISQTIHIANTINFIDSSYIHFTLNSVNYSWAYPDSIQAWHVDTSGTFNSTQISGLAGNQWINFYILNDNASPGTYSITLSTILNGNSYPNNSATTTVTSYGSIGNYIFGTASGQVRQLDSTTNIPFTMDYRVKRLQ